MWLPRILQKGRQICDASLPPEYAERFCHPTGVDNQFLTFFSLTKDDILDAAKLSHGEASQWFARQASPVKIAEWNRLAENLGRPGFPMAERLPVALSTTYRHLDASKITSVFDALEADDKIS